MRSAPGVHAPFPGKPWKPHLRSAGCARDRRGGQGTGNRDADGQYLGDAALFPGRQPWHRSVHSCLHQIRSEEHTSELQSLMRTSSAVVCLKKNTTTTNSQVYST